MSRGLRDNYQTYFGSTNTRDENLNFPIMDIINAHLQVRNHALDQSGNLYVDTDLLNPTIPDISKLPARIQQSFEGIIAAQTEIGSEKTAVKPLIAIHRSLMFCE